ncbi:MAG: class I SAM-dependent methyltransferase [Bacteroidota bacterium]|nr:class I SAM-dependent methyltransferase [bacterium]MBU1873954.1 class I SAM-dependent methyltransferase [bacterium]
MKKIIKSLIPEKVLVGYHKFKQQKSEQKHKKLFKGNNVKCPICNSTYRIFDSFGEKARENAQCYNCKSLERHRLLFMYLSEKLSLFNNNPKPIRLLHFAPEKVFYNRFTNMKMVEYTPCDLFPELYNYNGSIEIIKVDITNIPFEDDFFDFILCNHVLEHIPNDKLAISELYRVMKKGGSGILQVPIDYNRKVTYEDWTINTPEEREKAFGQSDHVRRYGQDYKIRLKGGGFLVHEDSFIKTFTSEEIFKFGLIGSELIYYCEK